MLLRNYLNEFELDWAQAPVRSGLILGKKLKGANVLLIGEQPELQRAIEWSFRAWNDKENAGIRVQEAFCEDGELQIVQGMERRVRHQEQTEKENAKGMETEQIQEQSFKAEEADYVILTGCCCRQMNLTALETMEYLKEFGELLDAIAKIRCRKVLLLSDGRVYGTLAYEFAASEYEAGRTDTAAGSEIEAEGTAAGSLSANYETQYLMATMEAMVTECARENGFSYEILRTGMIYGPCISMMEHPLAKLAEMTAFSREEEMELSPWRTSYICIHDVLTAIQFVLTQCPDNKIFNVSGLDSDAAPGEIAMKLYHNFPQQCRISMKNSGSQKGEGILLNTQLLCHYGFRPQISLEDGLIILVKSMQNTGEVFIFDNTYLGKLKKVQKILLGYLLEIDRICKKYDIKYFLAGGTLLGAIRHHGFIPWDDDADVMMLREDYDKFQKVAKKELPEHIFLQLPETEKGNYNPFTKLRINDTMFATEFTGHFMEMHNGIFFDVLSHDKTGNRKWSQKLHLMITMLTRSIVFNKWGNTDIKSGGSHPIICKIVDKAKYLVPMRLALWAQNHSLEFFKNRKSSYLYDGMGRNLKRGSFPARWLEEAIYVDFEGYQFPVPKDYDKYLTYLYGDYMQMIPVSQRRTSHSIVLMDLGSYSDYEEPREKQ